MNRLFKNRKHTPFIAILISFAFIANSLTLPALAKDNAIINSISISPLWQKITLLPGEEYRGTFKISNPSTANTDLKYDLRVAPYSVSGSNYNDPSYNEESTSTQIVNWISYDWTYGLIGIGETVEIPYTINVPKDAPAGGQYAVLFASGYSSQDEDLGGTGVADIKEIGSIIYAIVAGETNTSGKIMENKIPSIITTAPLKVSSMVENDGNVHADATYKLQVFPLFSDEEVFTNEEKPEINLILPDTSYYNTVEWDNPPVFGIFRAVQTIEFLGEKSITEKYVIICPIWLLFIIVFAIIIIIFYFVAKSKSRKKK